MMHESTWYIRVIQSLPHFDLTFRNVDSTFNPFSTKYVESIIFWAAVPVVWLLLTLLVFLVFFCTRCCKPKERKQKKSACLTISIIVIVLLSCGSIGVGFYGNERTTKSIHSVFKIVDRVYTIIDSIKEEVLDLQETLNKTLFDGLDRIVEVVESHPELPLGIRADLNKYTDDAVKFVKQIQEKAKSVTDFVLSLNLRSLTHSVDLYEFIRWIVMLVVFSCLALVCLAAAVAIGTSSRVLLMLFCIFGIVLLVVCFLLTSIHLALVVSAADFCIAPTKFIVDVLPTPVERDVFKYFLTCDANAPNPLNTDLQPALGLLKSANSTVRNALSMADKFIASSELQAPVFIVYNGMNEIGFSIIRLVSLFHCNLVHQIYDDVINIFCTIAISGILLILLSCCLTGFLLSILILMALRACRMVGLPHSFSYNLVFTETDDCCRGRHDGPRDAVKVDAVRRRTTPPPSYSSSEFYRQYSDVIHTSDESRTDGQESTS